MPNDKHGYTGVSRPVRDLDPARIRPRKTKMPSVDWRHFYRGLFLKIQSEAGTQRRQKQDQSGQSLPRKIAKPKDEPASYLPGRCPVSDLTYQVPVGITRLSHIGTTRNAVIPMITKTAISNSRICATGKECILLSMPVFHEGIWNFAYLIGTTLRSIPVQAGPSTILFRKASIKTG